MPAASGPCAKRMRSAAQVQVNDVGGGMDLVTVSRLVRDLCRQQTLDRATWQDAVGTFEDHATRLESIEGELLQVNDQTAEVFDRATAGQVARDAALTAHLNKSVADVSAAAQMIDSNLRITIAEAHAEFQSHKEQSTAFAKNLDEKMANLAVNLEARFNALQKTLDDANLVIKDPAATAAAAAATAAAAGPAAAAAAAAAAATAPHGAEAPAATAAFDRQPFLNAAGAYNAPQGLYTGAQSASGAQG